MLITTTFIISISGYVFSVYVQCKTLKNGLFFFFFFLLVFIKCLFFQMVKCTVLRFSPLNSQYYGSLSFAAGTSHRHLISIMWMYAFVSYPHIKYVCSQFYLCVLFFFFFNFCLPCALWTMDVCVCLVFVFAIFGHFRRINITFLYIFIAPKLAIN